MQEELQNLHIVLSSKSLSKIKAKVKIFKKKYQDYININLYCKKEEKGFFNFWKIQDQELFLSILLRLDNLDLPPMKLNISFRRMVKGLGVLVESAVNCLSLN